MTENRSVVTWWWGGRQRITKWHEEPLQDDECDTFTVLIVVIVSRCINMSKLIKLYSLNMFYLLYVYHMSNTAVNRPHQKKKNGVSKKGRKWIKMQCPAIWGGGILGDFLFDLCFPVFFKHSTCNVLLALQIEK